jgi:hypothetical protein
MWMHGFESARSVDRYIYLPNPAARPTRGRSSGRPHIAGPETGHIRFSPGG